MNQKIKKIKNDIFLSPIPGVITYNYYNSLVRLDAPSNWKEKLNIATYTVLQGGFVDGISTIPYFFTYQALQGDTVSQVFLGLTLGYRAITNLVLNYTRGKKYE